MEEAWKSWEDDLAACLAVATPADLKSKAKFVFDRLKEKRMPGLPANAEKVQLAVESIRGEIQRSGRQRISLLSDRTDGWQQQLETKYSVTADEDVMGADSDSHPELSVLAKLIFSSKHREPLLRRVAAAQLLLENVESEDSISPEERLQLVSLSEPGGAEGEQNHDLVGAVARALELRVCRLTLCRKPRKTFLGLASFGPESGVPVAYLIVTSQDTAVTNSCSVRLLRSRSAPAARASAAPGASEHTTDRASRDSFYMPPGHQPTVEINGDEHSINDLKGRGKIIDGVRYRAIEYDRVWSIVSKEASEPEQPYTDLDKPAPVKKHYGSVKRRKRPALPSPPEALTTLSKPGVVKTEASMPLTEWHTLFAEPLTKESVDMVMALYNDGLGAWRNHANLTGPTEQPGVKSPIDDSINICHEARMRVHNVTDDLTLPIVGEEGAGKGVAGSEIIQDCAHDDSQQMGVETITCDRDKLEPPAVDAARRPLLDDMKRRMFQVDEQWDDETKKRINMSETDIYDSLDMRKDALRTNTPEWLLGREVLVTGGGGSVTGLPFHVVMEPTAHSPTWYHYLEVIYKHSDEVAEKLIQFEELLLSGNHDMHDVVGQEVLTMVGLDDNNYYSWRDTWDELLLKVPTRFKHRLGTTRTLRTRSLATIHDLLLVHTHGEAACFGLIESAKLRIAAKPERLPHPIGFLELAGFAQGTLEYRQQRNKDLVSRHKIAGLLHVFQERMTSGVAIWNGLQDLGLVRMLRDKTQAFTVIGLQFLRGRRPAGAGQSEDKIDTHMVKPIAPPKNKSFWPTMYGQEMEEGHNKLDFKFHYVDLHWQYLEHYQTTDSAKKYGWAPLMASIVDATKAAIARRLRHELFDWSNKCNLPTYRMLQTEIDPDMKSHSDPDCMKLVEDSLAKLAAPNKRMKDALRQQIQQMFRGGASSSQRGAATSPSLSGRIPDLPSRLDDISRSAGVRSLVGKCTQDAAAQAFKTAVDDGDATVAKYVKPRTQKLAKDLKHPEPADRRVMRLLIGPVLDSLSASPDLVGGLHRLIIDYGSSLAVTTLKAIDDTVIQREARCQGLEPTPAALLGKRLARVHSYASKEVEKAKQLSVDHARRILYGDSSDRANYPGLQEMVKACINTEVLDTGRDFCFRRIASLKKPRRKADEEKNLNEFRRDLLCLHAPAVAEYVLARLLDDLNDTLKSMRPFFEDHLKDVLAAIEYGARTTAHSDEQQLLNAQSWMLAFCARLQVSMDQKWLDETLLDRLPDDEKPAVLQHAQKDLSGPAGLAQKVFGGPATEDTAGSSGAGKRPASAQEDPADPNGKRPRHPDV